MRMKLDQAECTGCYACYVACIAEHHKPQEEQAESFRTIRKRKEEGLEKQVCTGCTHCGRCIQACPEGAIYREEKFGIVLVNQELCNGCRQCEKACPSQAVRFSISGRMEKCDGCIGRLLKGREPACVRACFTGAISCS